MTRLILNADDFGMAPGVNCSILELNAAGALSSATLMATAAHTAAAARAATHAPRLGVGCHIVLVDGTPALPPAQIPTLVTASGNFRPTLGSFVTDLLRGKISPAEIEAEATAQIRRLQHLSITLTHLDTHKHTHMFSGVLNPVLRAAITCGIAAIRNPFEPEWAIHATPNAPLLRKLQVRALRTQQKTFLNQVQKAGIATTDGAIGVLATGTLDAQTIQSLLHAMPTGTWELVTHPGHIDEDLNKANTRLRATREVEHDALLKTIPAFLQQSLQTTLIHYGQIKERPA